MVAADYNLFFYPVINCILWYFIEVPEGTGMRLSTTNFILKYFKLLFFIIRQISPIYTTPKMIYFI